LAYENYFVMIPTGPRPSEALTEGFFALAAQQSPRPATMAILAADAPFSKSPVAGAREHANRFGFHVISEDGYPLALTDFTPVISQLKQRNPDILFLCSYLNDSVGLLRAMDDVGLAPKIVGGAMIGPQNGSVKAALGRLLNGLVNYEYWLPVPKLTYPGVGQMISEYQSRAAAEGADPLGYYVAPQAYAQMQIVEQAVAATGSLDDAKLAQFTRDHAFKTILGELRFGAGGGWLQPRVLQVQYRNIRSNDLSNFRDAETQAVVWPPALASAAVIYPYAKAKRNV
jgi:branched-chain amino acid transport system substrate-binding protein